ncbi:transporter [Paenibacillus sp. T2-29]|uniref:transporter n=1 Tax=Paenibacillus TaxID=44249 RepID=UPI0039BD3149
MSLLPQVPFGTQPGTPGPFTPSGPSIPQFPDIQDSFPSPVGPPPGPGSFSPQPFSPPPQGPFGPQGGQQAQAPTSPPPQFTPPKPLVSAYAVDPGAIFGCLYRNTFVWLTNGERFWMYPVFVGRTSVAGFRWSGRFWFYYGVDTNRIESFSCFW